VAGASGFVGRRLCVALDQAGHDVVAMTRNPDRYRGAGTPAHGDVQDRATLEPAMAGCQAAYYLVHSLQDADFADKDAAGSTTFGAAAGRAGLRRIIYLGGLGEDADDLSAHLRSRREVESLLGAGGVPVTVIRAGIIIGHGGISWELTRQLVEHLPVMITPQWVATRTQPIAVDDVVRYLAGVLELPEAPCARRSANGAPPGRPPRDEAARRRSLGGRRSQGANMTTGAGTAREAGAAGALTQAVTLPPGYAVDQGTDRGLLLAPVSPQPGTVVSKLWDPVAPQAGQAFDQVLAAGPSEIAWASRCTPACGVQTLNLATGKHTVISLPAGSSVTSGAFSPDGSLLALQMSFGTTGDGGELAMQLEVAHVATGRLTVVPGTWASSDAFVGFGWPTNGDNLVAEFSFTAKTQLASWQPGASRPAVTAIRPGLDRASLILG
jgi:uncharacterized protein YbjT (DUF2867 family)